MPKSDNQARIVAATVQMLESDGETGVTLDGVAAIAGCAKGLVNYHFRSRSALLLAAQERIGEDRLARWRRAFLTDAPDLAIEASWEILEHETDGGVFRAMSSLACVGAAELERMASQHSDLFTLEVEAWVLRLFEQMALRPTTPVAHLALLLASIVHGIERQLFLGGDADELHEAYAAGWLGVLSQAEAA